MGSRIASRRGGYAAKATRFEDTILTLEEAAALLRRSISRVRAEAQAGELPVEGWANGKPYFKAGEIMALSPS